MLDSIGGRRKEPGSAVRLLAFALLLATVIGAVSTVILKTAFGLAGSPIPWAEAATGWVDWYLWAALTPLVVWLARALPVGGDGWPRALAGHAALAVVVCAAELALYALVMTAYVEVLLGGPPAPFGDRYLALLGRWLPLQMLIYALIVAVVTAVEHGRRARERDVAAARLETELARAQMHALQAQIRPHFLFNTLNTVSMAVRAGEGDAAVRMMGHLGRLLRRSTEAAVRPETTLERELDFVRDYLRLERYRMEGRLEVRWEVDEAVLDAPVPTMLLQPLVENAVRHGIAELAEGGTLVIAAASRNGAVVLRVEDSGTGPGPRVEPGTGLENVRRRLEARYGPAADLRLEARAGGGTVAHVTFPYTADEPSSPSDSGAHPGAHRRRRAGGPPGPPAPPLPP